MGYRKRLLLSAIRWAGGYQHRRRVHLIAFSLSSLPTWLAVALLCNVTLYASHPLRFLYAAGVACVAAGLYAVAEIWQIGVNERRAATGRGRPIVLATAEFFPVGVAVLTVNVVLVGSPVAPYIYMALLKTLLVVMGTSAATAIYIWRRPDTEVHLRLPLLAGANTEQSVANAQQGQVIWVAGVLLMRRVTTEAKKASS